MPRPATLTLRVSSLVRPATVSALAASLLLAACSTQSPAQTTVPYQSADGVGAQVGKVEARGMVVVAASKGASGVLTGSLINNANDPVTVTFLTADQVQAGATSGATMQLKGREQTQISGVQFANLPTAPGALTSLVLQTPTAGQSFVDVPVLLPDGFYSSITATTAPTTSSATSTATTSATTSVTTSSTTRTTSSTSRPSTTTTAG